MNFFDDESDQEFWDNLEIVEDSGNSTETVPPVSFEEKIKNLSTSKADALDKLKMLQARKQKMNAQFASSEKKARNHRLYRLGETMESILKRPVADDDVDKLELFFSNVERAKFFTDAMNKELNCNESD